MNLSIKNQNRSENPGLRTRGDHIPWNNQGEVKVYYGLDRIKGQVGGSAAYAAAITGFSPILNTKRFHGLRNYPPLFREWSTASQIARHGGYRSLHGLRPQNRTVSTYW